MRYILICVKLAGRLAIGSDKVSGSCWKLEVIGVCLASYLAQLCGTVLISLFSVTIPCKLNKSEINSLVWWNSLMAYAVSTPHPRIGRRGPMSASKNLMKLMKGARRSFFTVFSCIILWWCYKLLLLLSHCKFRYLFLWISSKGNATIGFHFSWSIGVI